MEMLNLTHADMYNINSNELKEWLQAQWHSLPETIAEWESRPNTLPVWKKVMNLLLLEADLRQLPVSISTEILYVTNQSVTEYEELRWCPTSTLINWIKNHFRLTEIQKMDQDSWISTLLALRKECNSRGINVLLNTHLNLTTTEKPT